MSREIRDLNGQDVKLFYKKLGKVLGIKFCEVGKYYKVLNFFLNRIIKKYLPIPGTIDLSRPMIIRNTVLIDFKIGGKGDTMEMWRQLKVAVHEAGHAIRIKDYAAGAGRWYGEYLCRGKFRALEEAMAAATTEEFRFAFFGGATIEKIDLFGYLLLPEAQKIANIAYGNRIRRLEQMGPGYAFDKASMTAIQIMRGMGFKTMGELGK